MIQSINEIKQIALKTRVYTIGAIVICALLCIATMLLYRPSVKIDETDIKNIEAQRKAIIKQNEALSELSKEQSKSSRFFAYRDSLLKIEIKLNRDAIEKIKLPNETVKRINNYGSRELSEYFSKLPDPR